MKIEKQVKKSVKIALIFLSVGLLLGTIIIYAATPSSTFYISGGVYPGTPTYTVWKEGNDYFAKDKNGQLKYSGTNASQLLQSCVTSLTSGGNIYILKGEYLIDSTITVASSGIYLEGEDLGHHASGARPNTGTTLKLTANDIPIFIWQNTSSTVNTYFGGMKNIHLYGQSDNGITGGKGILINGGASDLLFDYVFLDLFHSYGFEITANKAKTWNIWVRNCLVESCAKGFYIHGTIPYDAPPIDYDVYDWKTRIIDRVNIEFCHTWGNTRDVQIDGHEVHNVLLSENQFYGSQGDSILIANESRRIIIAANRIYDWGRDGDDLYDGIRVEGWAYDIEIYGNIMGDHWEDGDRYAVHLIDHCRDIQVYGNDFAVEEETNLVKASDGERIFIHHNKGFITENSGVTEAADNDYIAHGLSGVPTAISLTVNETDARYIAQVESTNSTHFQLYLYDETAATLETVDKTMFWMVTYEP